jgi:hypothetical protein
MGSGGQSGALRATIQDVCDPHARAWLARSAHSQRAVPAGCVADAEGPASSLHPRSRQESGFQAGSGSRPASPGGASQLTRTYSLKQSTASKLKVLQVRRSKHPTAAQRQGGV